MLVAETPLVDPEIIDFVVALEQDIGDGNCGCNLAPELCEYNIECVRELTVFEHTSLQKLGAFCVNFELELPAVTREEDEESLSGASTEKPWRRTNGSDAGDRVVRSEVEGNRFAVIWCVEVSTASRDNAQNTAIGGNTRSAWTKGRGCGLVRKPRVLPRAHDLHFIWPDR